MYSKQQILQSKDADPAGSHSNPLIKNELEIGRHDEQLEKNAGTFSSLLKMKPAPPQTDMLQMKTASENINRLQMQSIGNAGLVIQPRLTIDRPGDQYEKQADRIAEKVVNGKDPVISRDPENKGVQLQEEEEELLQPKSFAEQITPLVQRQEEEEEELLQPKLLSAEHQTLQRQAEPEEEEEELLQPKLLSAEHHTLQRQAEPEEEEEEEPILTKGKSSSESEVNPGIEPNINSLKGRGQPLSKSVRNYFEPRFGYDFNNVRVLTDTKAAESARQLNARAYTSGSDIVFGTGEYAPETGRGRGLLAHELVHVVQQRTWKNKIQRQGFRSTINFNRRLFSRYFTVSRSNSLKATIVARGSPEGCSMPSTYRVYLYNTRERRYETSVSYPVNTRGSYTWKGLAGGTYQFIFLLEGAEEGCYLDGTIEVEQFRAVDNIIPTVRRYINSTRWAYSASTPPGPNTNKCNYFVYEVLNEAGASVPMMRRYRFGIIRRPDHPPLAGQWADSSVAIAGWNVVGTPQPGDVAAEAISYADASGHVGIVSSVSEDGSGTTISATSDSVVENDWGFRSGQNVTFRRYRGR